MKAFRSVLLSMVSAVALSTCVVPSAVANAQGTVQTLRGFVTYAASTTWNPPASFALATTSGVVWLDVKTNDSDYFHNDLVAARLARVRGYAEVNGLLVQQGGATVLQAYSVIDQTPAAPRMKEAEEGKAELCKVYLETLGLANSCGITLKDGRYAVSLSFADDASLKKYSERRRSLGHRSDVLSFFSQASRRTVTMAVVLEVTGPIVIFPTGGVVN